MKQFLKNWVLELFSLAQIKPLSERNKLLLLDDLKKCNTLSDIEVIKFVLSLCASDFKTEELEQFLIEIEYRRRMIEYVQDRLNRTTFQTHEIARLFNTSKSRIELDAIMLHLEINKDVYELKHPKLLIYKSMFAKRNDAINNALHTAYA